jgi:hypothetical protein
MSNNDSVPGMMFPTIKAPIAGNPRDSAMQTMNNNAQLQAQANTALAGGRHRKRKAYVGGNTIPVPQFNVLYNEVSGPGTGVNSQVQGNAQTSTQMAANSALDSGATKMGGTKQRISRRRSRKGGNPDWVWGCMSGGKKRRSRKTSRKNNKSRKNRRSRKH